MVTKMPGRVALHKTNEREQPDTKQGEHLTLKKRTKNGNREHQSDEKGNSGKSVTNAPRQAPSVHIKTCTTKIARQTDRQTNRQTASGS